MNRDLDGTRKGRPFFTCAPAALALSFLLACIGMPAGEAEGGVAPPPPGTGGRPPVPSRKSLQEELDDYKEKLLSDPWRPPVSEIRDPLVFRQVLVVGRPPMPTGDPGFGVEPTEPPNGDGESTIQVAQLRRGYEVAEENFLRSGYSEVGPLCDKIIDRVDKFRRDIAERQDFITPEQQRQLEEAERYAERADRLKRTAERLLKRLKAEKEFAALPIEIEAVIWSERGRSWAVVNGRAFDERAVRGRALVPGIRQRGLYICGIEPGAVIFSYRHAITLYRMRREIGASRLKARGAAAGGGALSGTPAGALPGARRPAAPAARAPPRGAPGGGPAAGGVWGGLGARRPGA